MVPEADWHALPASEVVERLRTSVSMGLSEAEASARRAAYGPNELRAAERISPVKIFFKQFANLLLAILIVATAISAVLRELVDAIVIFIIVLFVVILGFYQEFRAEKALEALKRMLSPSCTVRRDGTERELAVKELVPGDIVLLEAGDRVPADMRLVEVVNLKIDEAPLTGESVPVTQTVEPVPASASVADRDNMAFSGTTVTYGKGIGVVVATGMATEFGKIAAALTTVERERTPLERRMAEIGRKLGLIAVLVIVMIVTVELVEEFVLLGRFEIDFLLKVLLFSIALAVAAVPEALPAIVTANLAIGMRIMAKRNALVRKMPAVETLGSTEIICADKTGTLTKGEMTVRRILVDGRSLDVTGVGYEPDGTLLRDGDTVNLTDDAVVRLARAALLCNDARLEREDSKRVVRGDPTEGALVVLAEKAKLDPTEVRRTHPRIGEVPFSSERKLMTTVHRTPDDRRVAYMKGAPEVVVARCARLLEGGAERELRAEDRARLLRLNDEMAANGLRVLGVADRVLPSGLDPTDETRLERDFVFLGLVGMMDPPRTEALEAVQVARGVGMRPIMITGDHKQTALAIAREMKIHREGDRVLTGDELERIGEEEFNRDVERVSVYARVSPSHKLRIVTAWKKRGRVVAMTGDGVNDAPALKRSDIGIAMGITGTDVAKEASHMVLADDNFATIVKAIEHGRWIYDNIKKYLAYLLQANLVEIAVLSIGALFVLRFLGFGGEETLPLLPVHILYINLATDGLPALALSFSPPDPDLMKRPPRPKHEPVFSREVKIFLVRALLVETPILMAAFVSGLPAGIEAARTRLFLMFVFVELAVAINCRSLVFTINRAKPHKWLLLTIAWETVLILTLIQFAGIREALHVLVPTLDDVLWITAGVVATFLTMEGLKRVIPLRESGGQAAPA